MGKTKEKAKKDEAPELEELEQDETTDEAPAKGKGKKKGEDDVEFGASDLAKLVSKETGKDYDARAIRTLLRKMAKDGRIKREIIPGNKARYNWPGGKDHAEVKAVLKAVKGGEIEAARKEALDNLKEKKAKDKVEKGKKDKKEKKNK